VSGFGCANALKIDGDAGYAIVNVNGNESDHDVDAVILTGTLSGSGVYGGVVGSVSENGVLDCGFWSVNA
jgi:hypothetical protein